MALILSTLILIFGWAYFSGDQIFQGTADVFLNWIFPLIAVMR